MGRQCTIGVLIIAGLARGHKREQKSQTKFLPWWWFELPTARLVIQQALHWTTSKPHWRWRYEIFCSLFSYPSRLRLRTDTRIHTLLRICPLGCHCAL